MGFLGRLFLLIAKSSQLGSGLYRGSLCAVTTLGTLGRLMVCLESRGCGAAARSRGSSSEVNTACFPKLKNAKTPNLINCRFLPHALEACYALWHIVIICRGTQIKPITTLGGERRYGAMTKPTVSKGVHTYVCIHGWPRYARTGHRGTWDGPLGVRYAN